MKIRFFAFAFCLFLLSCTSNTGQFDTFRYGKVDKKIVVSGAEREYTLHVPTGYQGNKALPLVLVLHDTNGTGSTFYQSSGWPSVCQRENIFAVFPTALSYCTGNPGGTDTRRIWNTGTVATPSLCAGVVMEDDIAFFDQLCDRLSIDYNIDKKRIYVVGFGNGGQMAARSGLEMGHRVAAITQFAGSFTGPGNWQSTRDVPVLFQVGNQDDVFFRDKKGLPLASLEEGISDENNPLFLVAKAYTGLYALSDGFTLAGDTTAVVKAVFYKNSQSPLLEMSLVNNLGHSYPAGNQSFVAAEQHWNWLKTFILP